jgi:hypothetical protein
MSNPAATSVNFQKLASEYANAYNQGFEEGKAMEHALFKEQVIRILLKPLKNLDLSQDTCDSRYIEQINEL